MGAKKLIIETTSRTPLTYVAEDELNPRKGFLGKLKGPAADYNEPTRNDNYYSKQLWEKVVSSDQFTELFDAKCLFGEVDHPEDRLETLIKNAAISLVGYEFNDDNGTFDCEFDILDTPMGRIVKSLADYGSRLGVSSRGAGDVTTDETGVDIIDPDTYDFEAFDVVLLPAVRQARPTVVESVDKTDKSQRLIESIQSEIDQAESDSALSLIKSIVQSTNLPDSESLIDSIENKMADVNERDTISSGLLADLEAATDKITELSDQITDLNDQLVQAKEAEDAAKKAAEEAAEALSKVEESCTTGSDIKSVRESLSVSRKNGRYLSSRVVEYKKKLRGHRKVVEELENSKRIIEDLKSKVSDYEVQLEEYMDSILEYTDKISMLESKNKTLVNTANQYKSKLASTTKTNKLTESTITKRSHQELSESKRLLSEYKSMYSNDKIYYIESKCRELGINSDVIKSRVTESMTIYDIDKVINSYSDQLDRFNRVPIDLSGRSFKLESVSSADKSDDGDYSLSLLKLTKDRL